MKLKKILKNESVLLGVGRELSRVRWKWGVPGKGHEYGFRVPEMSGFLM